MNIQKCSGVCASGVVDEAALEKINRYTKTPLAAREVYRFGIRLCDDQPDRDNERFDTAALPILAELLRGKTGIEDHDWSAKRQIARIFDTEVVSEDGVTYLRADCYMLRTEKNADLIAEIEGGIKKEVSVACAVAETKCGICGKPYGTCEHRKGQVYDGQVCCAVLCDPTDAYEFSFVAVPAQREAGVTKAMEGGVCMTLQELVSKNGTPELTDRLKSLERQAQFGRSCRDALVDEVVALGLLLDFGADEGLLRKAFASLDFSDLNALKKAMSKKSAALFPEAAQLASDPKFTAATDAAFII